jgi:hypothetical protein
MTSLRKARLEASQPNREFIEVGAGILAQENFVVVMRAW